jgi:DNA-binding response OmpR family regulator
VSGVVAVDGGGDAAFTCSSQHANAPVIVPRLHGRMTRSAPASGHGASPLALLTTQERAVYDVLARHAGTVVSRAAIASEAGMGDLNVRRCDSLIVGIRRCVGANRIVTVRRRGWMLVDPGC